MADHDVESHLQALLTIWLSPTWVEFWREVSCEIESFERLGITNSATDSEIWQLCQEREIVLITGNRNAEGDESLEATIRQRRTPQSFLVFTIADPDRLMRDRRYAEDVAAQTLDYLRDLENLRGTGRLFIP